MVTATPSSSRSGPGTTCSTPGSRLPSGDRLTASAGHQAVDHHPITRYEIAAGYLNLPALAAQPDTYPTTEDTS
jgi:hypothetical protein